MSGSYVGLLAAAASETITRRFHMPMALGVTAATGVVILLGVIGIRIWVPKALASMRNRNV